MIGAIADDYTGATDAAVAFRREGLRTVLVFGVPATPPVLPPHDALVVALKSRTVPAGDAVAQSLEALAWLREHGVDQVYFKYCSTFDSTPEGNIGPVLDALADELAADVVLQTPSSPEHLRTQYLGHLFVGDVLLSESHMRHHPLNPMTDSLLPRVLGRQTSRRVSLIRQSTVRSGPEAIRAAVAQARADGERYLLVDAIDAADLTRIGQAVLDMPLVAGGAGLAAGIAAAITLATPGSAGSGVDDTDPVGNQPAAVLAGSCSARTLEQIQVLKDSGRPCYLLDAGAVPDADGLAEGALSWYDTQPPGPAPLIFSSLAPEQLHAVQAELGVQRSAEILEGAIGRIAVGLVARGVRRIVSAGGETSGAVVTALGVDGGEIGPEAATGVPWIYTTTADPLALLLKSGNFGDADLLRTASAAPEAAAV
jgi:uncharacterized protein YgbK (DUF1537 family)